MLFYSKLYVGERVRNLRQIKSRLKKGSLFTNAYIITFAEGNDLLEIYDSKIFAQKHYKDFPRMVVGIATDYNEAVGLVVKIMDETFEKRQDCNVKAYLNNNMS